MTLDDFRTLILSVDSDATRYEAADRTKRAYTIWRETRRIGVSADGRWQGGWKVYVDRWTQDEDDAIAAALLAALDDHDGIALTYETDYEEDTGYIHHIYECEVA